MKKIIEKKTKTRVELGRVDLSWLGPQYFEQVKWERQSVTGGIEKLSIHAPFWSFSGPIALKNAFLSYEGKEIERLDGEVDGQSFALKGKYITLQGTFHRFQAQAKDFPLPSGSNIDFQGEFLWNKGRLELASALDGSLMLHTEKLKSKTPILFHLASASCSLPFSKENLKAIGTVDFSKMQGKSDEKLNALLALFHVSSTKEMDLWFAPVSFTLDHGMLSMERLDFLVSNALHFCLWGKVDLKSDQLYLTLGLPADTLSKSFGIRNLSKNYVIKIDVRGTIQEPSIAKKTAAAKIAALVASNQIPKNTVLGAIAGALSSPKEEKGVPPAKHPFPWE